MYRHSSSKINSSDENNVFINGILCSGNREYIHKIISKFSPMNRRPGLDTSNQKETEFRNQFRLTELSF